MGTLAINFWASFTNSGVSGHRLSLIVGLLRAMVALFRAGPPHHDVCGDFITVAQTNGPCPITLLIGLHYEDRRHLCTLDQHLGVESACSLTLQRLWVTPSAAVENLLQGQNPLK